MLIFKTGPELYRYLEQYRKIGRQVGFVPTMGALHEGHLALVRRSLELADLTVLSIFVNPTQFNQQEDLEKYPRQPEKDLLLLSSIGNILVFLPNVEEVYPPGENLEVPLDLGHLEEVMEGSFRPGHFAGVAQVVKRLLDLVGPDHLIMGQKDLQQISVIDRLITSYRLPVNLVSVPTQRDAGGLALSSRNQRLSPSQRQKAAYIHKTLSEAGVRYLQGNGSSELGEWGRRELEGEGFRVEYFEIVKAESLKPLLPEAFGEKVAICTAAWLGDVRLIDNIIVKP